MGSFDRISVPGWTLNICLVVKQQVETLLRGGARRRKYGSSMARCVIYATVASQLVLVNGLLASHPPMGRPRSFHSCCRTSRTPSRQNSALRMSFLPEGWDSSPTANQNGNSSSGGGGGGLQLPGFRFRVEDKFGFGLPKLPIVERLVQSLRCIRPGMMFKRGEEIFVRQAISAAATTADATIAALPHAHRGCCPCPLQRCLWSFPCRCQRSWRSIAIDLTFSFWACALEIKTSTM